jgi:hypothetical protein
MNNDAIVKGTMDEQVERVGMREKQRISKERRRRRSGEKLLSTCSLNT